MDLVKIGAMLVNLVRMPPEVTKAMVRDAHYKMSSTMNAFHLRTESEFMRLGRRWRRSFSPGAVGGGHLPAVYCGHVDK